MAAAFVVSRGLQDVFGLDADRPRDFAWLLIWTTGVTTVIWLAVTFLTPPEPADRLRAFYRRVRPGGMGWAAAVPEAAGDGGLGRGLVQWVVGCLVVYLALFGIGDVVLGRGFRGVGALLLTVGLTWWLVNSTAAQQGVKSPVVS